MAAADIKTVDALRQLYESKVIHYDEKIFLQILA